MMNQIALTYEMSNLKKFALRLTGNRHDADDLLQATLLRAMEKSDLFQSGTNLFSWTSKIMYNLFVSGYRRKAKFETQYDPELVIGNESVEASQDTKVELAEVTHAMKSLSHEHQCILVMICVKDMSYAEVAEVLDIPIGTVRSRLFRARESLQAVLSSARALEGWTNMPLIYAQEHKLQEAA